MFDRGNAGRIGECGSEVARI
uniref:Uncharacterized protein n=1 Tax=Anopheles minimus TaxID=112268 RepID=A0A182WP02_9DIPT